MISRRIAALALVGWYLMTPPLKQDQTVDTAAPLSRWTITNGFDKADDCETIKLRVQGYLPDPQTGKQGPVSTNPRQTNMVCIEADDPRLKGN